MALSVSADKRRTRVGQVVPLDGAHDGDAVHVGHLVVDQRHLWSFACDDLQRLAAILGLPQHLDPPALGQPAGHPVPEKRMIVDHDHGHQSCHRRRIRSSCASDATSW